MAFNVSMFFFGISLILFLCSFLIEDNSIIKLEIPSHLDSKKGSIKIGRVLKGSIKKHNFFLSIKDLEKHMFICGTTGTGKTNFIQNFLVNFTKNYDIPFFLVEFKGEYHFLQRRIEDLLILWPGENFSINIFNPQNTSPIIHAERIFDILKSGKFLDDSFEYTPQMEKVLVEILTEVCKNEEIQNWIGFEDKCKEYLNKNLKNIPMLGQTLISIKNRIRRFSKGPLSTLFETNNEIEVKELFSRNILLDLSSIIRLGGEKDDALFFLNMILKYLWDRNISRGAHNFKGIRHLTIIEDAQYFAPQDLVKRKKLSTYLEDIALMQRGTGECLISIATRPDISKEILANNGVVATFKNHIEKDIMCELLNLDVEKKKNLSILKEGQCIIRVNSIKEPFLLWIPHISRESIPFSEIISKNKQNFNKFRQNTNSEENLINKNHNSIIKQRYQRFLKIIKKKAIRLKNLKKKFRSKRINEIKKVNENRKKKLRENGQYVKKKSIQSKKKTNNLKNSNDRRVNIKEVIISYSRIEHLYKANFIKDVVMECQNLINKLLKFIAQQIGFDYKDLKSFQEKLKELNLEKKFILFHEIVQFNNALENNDNKTNLELADSVFLIIKKIINKLKLNWYKRKNGTFSNGYNELNTIIRNNHNQGEDLIKINPESNNISIYYDKEQFEFNKLKLYINELINLQKKNT